MKKPIPFGKYLLLERVNVGGMAEVFKAKAFGVEGFERLVAVKRILPSIAEDQEFITMFIDEAKISVQLTHANIASIFDLGKVNESYFIAMEFVRGKDMRAIFDRLAKRGEAVPVPMASYVVMKVCEGLDYAHNKRDGGGQPLNLVHRDVSPQNILVGYDGEIKLIDFGIAKAANKAGKTQAGILKGKFGYMSPEQVRGLPLDRRSDVFAVGIVLYELLTGERLFVGESDFSTLEKVRNVEIMPPSTYNGRIPKELEQIVLKALAKDVEDRYQTAMDLHDDLQSFMYTSGNFFARKDLGTWMRRNWAEEIQKEEMRDEKYRQIKAPGRPVASRPPPPPPRSRPSSVSRPPAVSKPPPPPPRASKPMPKSTMLGMGGPPAQAPAFDMDWDEDELATQIYDKGNDASGPPPVVAAGPASSPGLSPSLGPSYGAASPSYGGGHTPLEAEPTQVPRLPPRGELPATPPSGAPSPFDAPSPSPQSAPEPKPRAVREPTAVLRQPKSDSRRWLPVVVAACFLLLSAVAAAILLWPDDPGTLIVTTDPRDAVVLLDNEPVSSGTQSPFLITNVTPGMQHTVEVRKTGFTTWRTQVELEGGQELRLPTIELEAEDGSDSNGNAAQGGTGFALTTTPAGAKVFVDGRELPGVTPMRVTDLTPGSHTIRAELAGRATWQRVFQFAEGTVMELAETLTAAEISVAFRSEPDGARVTLVRGDERRSIGRTPTETTVDVSGDPWRVEMTLSRYEDWNGPLRVPEGQTSATVRAELERASRGTDRGDVRPPRMVVTRMLNPIVRDTPMTTPMVTPMTTPMATGNGTVDINTRPWSEVYVDGRRVGNTPQRGLTLSAGRHRIRFVNPDFNISETMTITVRAGQNERVIRTLTPR
ncbi:MAG: PEGA domain-containing protein [Myxococcota bacterium]